jgi:hypothetical protein
VPRRTRPLVRRSEIDQATVEALRLKIKSVVDGRTVANNVGRFTRLTSEQRAGLIDDLVDAVGFAKAGLRDVLAGKETRAEAWTMDIFVRDVCDALRKVGVPVSMHQDPSKSYSQSLAVEVARVCRLPNQGKLYKQMQRANDITKRRLPDIYIEG